MNLEKEFIPYNESLALKELGFDEPCFGFFNKTWNKEKELLFPQYAGELENWNNTQHLCSAPIFSQAINFLYICSNKQIDIELKASDTYEERLRKITKGCEDLRNLQNNKSN